MSWVYYLVLIVLVALSYKVNLILGIALTVIFIAYALYRYRPTFYGVQAGKAFQAGDFEKSRDLYKKAMDTGYPKLQIRINYAYVLMRTGDYDEAENVLNYILKFKGVKPENKNMARQQRCMVYYKQGRLDEAIQDSNELYESGYRNTNLYGMMGYFKILTDPMSEDTLKFCLEAYDYNDDDRDILDNLSICYYNRGDYQKAKELSDKIMEDNPQFVEAYYHGAQIAVKLGEFDTAKEYLNKIPSCRRSNMTTVSEEEIQKLSDTVNKGAKG